MLTATAFIQSLSQTDKTQAGGGIQCCICTAKHPKGPNVINFHWEFLQFAEEGL